MSWQVEKALDDLMAQETGAVRHASCHGYLLSQYV